MPDTPYSLVIVEHLDGWQWRIFRGGHLVARGTDVYTLRVDAEYHGRLQYGYWFLGERQVNT